ncbi:MAG: hypothetical protein PVG32_11275 [Anaerolineales bacterium]|jgi:hypothetical protein
MELIEATVRFNSDGEITPLSFVWRGRSYTVVSTGRRWQAKDGVHILVMGPGDKVYHLLFSPEEMRWKILIDEQSLSGPPFAA